MSGISKALSSLFYSAPKNVLDPHQTPEEDLKFRKDSTKILDVLKIASVVTTIAAFFIFAIFPNIFFLVLAGTLAFATTEIHKAADNILEIFDQTAVEAKALSSRENCIAQIAKNTYIVGPILRVFSPAATTPKTQLPA